jgi:outer membrane autotransporter protein
MNKKKKSLCRIGMAGVLLAGFVPGTASANALLIGDQETVPLQQSDSYDYDNSVHTTDLSEGSGLTWGTYTYPNVTVEASDNTLSFSGYRAGIYAPYGSSLTVTAKKIEASSTTTEQLTEQSDWYWEPSPAQAAGLYADGSNVTLNAEDGITISGFNHGIYTSGMAGDIFTGINADDRTSIILSTQGDNVITATAGDTLEDSNPNGISGIENVLGADVTLTAGGNNIISVNSSDFYSSGIDVGTLNMQNLAFGTVTLSAGGDNMITGARYGIKGSGTSSTYFTPDGTPTRDYLAGKVILDAEGNNEVEGRKAALNLWNGMEASLTAGGTNILSSDDTGAQASTMATLTLTGSTQVDAPTYGILTRDDSDTTINANGGTLTITTETSPTVSYYEDGSYEITTRPIAVASLTGSRTTIENASLSIKSNIAFLAAHPVNTSGIFPAEPDPYEVGSTGAIYPSEGGSTADTEGASLSVTYGKDSRVNGDIIAYDGGTVTVTPSESGTLNLTGDLYAYGEDSSSVGNYFNVVTRIYTDPTLALPGGTISLTLDNDSTFEGTADTGLLNGRLWPYLTDGVSTPETGTIDLMLQNGSTWLMTDSSAITSLSGDGGTIYYQNGGNSLEIGTLSGSHTFAMDLDANDGSQSDMLYVVNGTSDKQALVVKNIEALDEEMDDGDAVRFATVKNPGYGFGNGTHVATLTSGIYNSLYTTEYRSVSSDSLNTDAYNNDRNGGATYTVGSSKPGTENVTALYGGDNAVNIYVVKEQELNEGAKTPSRLADLSWRYLTDLDTFTNRSGNTQYFTPGADQGAWIRFRYRNLGVDGIGELDGNTYELGYTTVLSDQEPHQHRLSASVAYTKNNGHFEGTSGNLGLRDTAISVYDTHIYTPTDLDQKPDWKKGTHSYWDSYLKYHYGKEDYSVTDATTGTGYVADYSRHSVNLSTEYGRENKLSKDWSFIPQAQVQLSYLGGYDTTDSEGLSLSMDHSWSLIGRAGFDLVKRLDPELDNKIYFKASLLHEFLDGDDMTTSYGSDRYIVDGDHKGTWGVIGLGYSVKTGDKQSMYFDVERYVGHDYRRTYNIRAGFNWKF